MRDEPGLNAVGGAGAGVYGQSVGFVKDQIMWAGVQKRQILPRPEKGGGFTRYGRVLAFSLHQFGGGPESRVFQRGLPGQ